jgi:predicted ribosome quality control (RQC) complex YloA/Tae2 family protein
VAARQRELESAREGPRLRRSGEALLTHIRQVPARAKKVSLPDPHDADRQLEIELDPALNAQANAARYFKRAARAERALAEIPARLAQAEAQQLKLDGTISRLEALETDDDLSESAERDLAKAIELIPKALRASLGLEESARAEAAAKSKTLAAKDVRAPSGKLQPRRLTTTEGWDVLIGRSNEGNDYLTLHVARPEDYWFHVHGSAGSHVVLRRGKGKNEPSKQTLEEVASWTAFYSQARTAGKVPVIYTRKKYVRKPRGSKPGLVTCEREKSVMVRPKEPPASALTSAQSPAD